MPPLDSYSGTNALPPRYQFAGSPPASLDPFKVAGTNMIRDYAMIQQEREVAQYQQLHTPPPQMSLGAQRAIAFNPEYQFGVMGGQVDNQESYLRRSELASRAFAVTGVTAGVAWPMFTKGAAFGSTISRGLGAGRILGGAIGMGAGMALTAPLYSIAQRGIERARFRADISQDISDFSGMMTQGAGFGRNATEALAGDMASTMDRGGFFGKQDQMMIHKVGLATGMIKGKNTSEYKKSFDSLKDNLKDIVHLMNTTIEGGLAVMKELEQSGFKNPQQQKQQIMQAKAWGASTGLGTQNMLSIGAAGAGAVVGTGWSAQAGANAFQGSTAIAANLARTDQSIAATVGQLGGTARAGASLASGTMNMLKSGMGLQTMAYMMDPETKQINADKFQRIMEGKAGALEIVTGANRYGMGGGRGGANNRIMAAKDVQDRLNSMSFTEQAMIARGSYQAWAKNRGGDDKYSAFAFAKMYNQNDQQAALMAEMLRGNLGVERLMASKSFTEAQQRQAGYMPRANPVSRAFSRAGASVNNWMNKAGDAMYTGIGSLLDAGTSIVEGAYGAINPGGAFFDNPTISSNRTLSIMTGNLGATSRDIDIINQGKKFGYFDGRAGAGPNLSKQEVRDIGSNLDFNEIVRTNDPMELQRALQSITGRALDGDASKMKDNTLMEIYGLEGGRRYTPRQMRFLADQTNKAVRRNQVFSRTSVTGYQDYLIGQQKAGSLKETTKRMNLARNTMEGLLDGDRSASKKSQYFDQVVKKHGLGVEEASAFYRQMGLADLSKVATFGTGVGRTSADRAILEIARTGINELKGPDGNAFMPGATTQEKTDLLRSALRAKYDNNQSKLDALGMQAGMTPAELTYIAKNHSGWTNELFEEELRKSGEVMTSTVNKMSKLPGFKKFGKERLERALLGNATRKDIKTFKQLFPTFGTKIKTAADLQVEALSSAAAVEQKSVLQSAQADYMKITRAIQDKDEKKIVDVLGEGKKLDDAKAEQTRLGQVIQTLREQGGAQNGNLSNTLQAQPAAPQVLNYWNNRWLP